MYFGFDNITITYGGQPLIRQLHLEVYPHEIAALIGPNGCGKSSLIRTVTRTPPGRSGRVIFRDRPLASYTMNERARAIAVLSQLRDTPPEMDVKTLVACGRYPYRRFGQRRTKEDERILENAMRLTGVDILEERLLSTLSGGELQRAWLSMVMAQQPEILILDEPTTYLDVGSQLEILELIRKINAESGTTILMVLHDLNQAARYADRIHAMLNGGIYASGTPGDVLTSDTLRTVFGIEAEIMWDEAQGCPCILPRRSLRS